VLLSVRQSGRLRLAQRTPPAEAPCLCRNGRALPSGAARAWRRPGQARGGRDASRRGAECVRAAAAHASVRRTRGPAPRPTLWAPGGAQVVAFLCSDKAAFVNGVALPIDGGFHLGKV